MPAATTKAEPLTYSTTVNLGPEALEKLREAAEAFDGNLSETMRALIDLHAGELVEIAAEVRDQEYPERTIERWKKRPLSMGLIEEVAARVYAGNRVDAAFDAVGVTPQQRGSWLAQGKRDRTAGKQSLHADLVAAIAKAEADREAEDVERWRKHGRTSWKALSELLERQHPDRYGPRKRVDSTMTHRMEPMIDYDRLDPAELKEFVRLLRKGTPDPSETMGQGRPAAELLPPEVLELAEGEYHEIHENQESRLLEAPQLDAGSEPA